MSQVNAAPTSPNAQRLLWAGFMAILAAGIGFAIRNGLLQTWATEYSFTAQELGKITGAGLTGFCFGIIIGGVVADKIGYGWLVIAAFVLHLVSAGATFMPDEQTVKTLAYNYLFWGAFIFAMANGVLEAVANPLVATLFPHNRTHYLNLLHASWPAGLILGGVANAVLFEQMDWPWKRMMALFLVPTAIYGLMFLGQRMPKSEASEKGLSLGEMFKDVGILGGLVVAFFLSLFIQDLWTLFLQDKGAAIRPWVSYGVSGLVLVAIAVITEFSIGSWLLFILFVTHAMVGAVELGTDTWIQNITGNILTPEIGYWLFVYTSAIMFLLRFCADFIERKLGIPPLGILLICSVLASVGLNLISHANTTSMVMAALLVYGVGKTFFWPTMLAVASDQFPRTGAVAISLMGGIGMLSAGLIGSPGLGYLKDRYSAETLEAQSPELFEEYKSPTDKKGFLFLPETTPLDAQKVGEIKKRLAAARDADSTGAAEVSVGADEQIVLEADRTGDRKTLRADSLIPATMAVIYLGLLLYFKSIGGYRVLRADDVPVTGHA